MYQEMQGDLIALTKMGLFDVVAHGCNCFCNMGAGIAVAMAKEFNCDHFPLEYPDYKGDINKLGQIDYLLATDKKTGKQCWIVNAYTQYKYGKNHADGESKPLDYNALGLCLKKINHIFKGKHIGLPKIGCGLAGGDWKIVKSMIQKLLKDCDVTVVIK